jgi:DNA-binding NarL/FixJ family response regulator
VRTGSFGQEVSRGDRMPAPGKGREDSLKAEGWGGATLDESLRVLIADDHPYYREGLARLLRRNGIEVVGEAPNGEAALRAVSETAPDVVIMDLNMPGMSGGEATRCLLERAPESRVIMLSVSAEDEDVTDAMRAGASGYLVKEAPVEQVIEGIRAAAAGQTLVSSRVATVLLRRVRDAIFADDFSPSTLLSGRELEVLSLLADGQTDHQIAKALGMTVSAVRDHAADIIKKLQLEGGVPSTVPAATSTGSGRRSGPGPSERHTHARPLGRFWPRGRGSPRAV